jgi:hypothetical protein
MEGEDKLTHYVEMSSDSPVSICGKFVSLCTDDLESVTCPQCLNMFFGLLVPRGEVTRLKADTP